MKKIFNDLIHGNAEQVSDALNTLLGIVIVIGLCVCILKIIF